MLSSHGKSPLFCKLGASIAKHNPHMEFSISSCRTFRRSGNTTRVWTDGGWGGATWLFCTCCEMAGEPNHMCYALWQMASQFKTPFSNTAFWDSRAHRRVLINFVNNDFYHSFSIGYSMTKRITHVQTFSQRTNEASSCNFNFCYISIILNSLIRDKIIIFPIVLFCWIAYSSIMAKKISLFN